MTWSLASWPVAILDHTGSGEFGSKAGSENRLMARRNDVDARNLQSAAEHHLLGHQQSRAGLRRRCGGDNLPTDCVLALDPDAGKLNDVFLVRRA